MSEQVGDLSIRALARRLREHGVKLWELSLSGDEFTAHVQKDTSRRGIGAPLHTDATEFIALCVAELATKGAN